MQVQGSLGPGRWPRGSQCPGAQSRHKDGVSFSLSSSHTLGVTSSKVLHLFLSPRVSLSLSPFFLGFIFLTQYLSSVSESLFLFLPWSISVSQGFSVSLSVSLSIFVSESVSLSPSL